MPIRAESPSPFAPRLPAAEQRRAPKHRLAPWLPDVSMAMAVVTLFYCLFLFDGWQRLFRDSDTGWHIRAGESILATRTLPASDPYSFSRAGVSWLDWEWASDALTAAAANAAGMAGVAVLFAASIALCTWLWFRLNFVAGGDLLLAALLAAPMLSTVNLHWLARPHVFGWVMLLLFLLLLEGLRTRRVGNMAYAAAFAVGMVWANLHGSFILAPALALLYAAGNALRPFIWDHPADGLWRNYLKVAAAVALGTCVNPYGMKLHGHVAAYLLNGELLSRIGEFQSFNFHADGSFQILIALLVAGLGAAAALASKRLEHFLISVLLLAAGLRSARALPIVALALLPLANGAITECLGRARGLAPALRATLSTFLDYSARLRVLDSGVSGWALVPVLLLALFALSRSPAIAGRAGFPPSEFPVAASAAVSELPAGARILAPDKFGGYLIYRFSGARKVYFDGRSDFYGLAFMKDYINLMEARPGWQEQVASHGFTHALLPPNYTLVSALGQLGWRTTYKDATAVLLAAPGIPHGS